MGRARDRYDPGKTERERLAEDQERTRRLRGWQLENGDVITAETIHACCESLAADVPGSFANTVLTTFVALPPGEDPPRWAVPRHIAPPYVRLRQMAWAALSGEWRAQCAELDRQRNARLAEQDDADDDSDDIYGGES